MSQKSTVSFGPLSLRRDIGTRSVTLRLGEARIYMAACLDHRGHIDTLIGAGAALNWDNLEETTAGTHLRLGPAFFNLSLESVPWKTRKRFEAAMNSVSPKLPGAKPGRPPVGLEARFWLARDGLLFMGAGPVDRHTQSSPSFSVKLADRLFGEVAETVLNAKTEEAMIPLPEGSYPATVTIKRVQLKRPFFPAEEVSRVDIACGVGITTNDHKRGTTHGLYWSRSEAITTGEAIGHMVGDVLRDRARNGWKLPKVDALRRAHQALHTRRAFDVYRRENTALPFQKAKEIFWGHRITDAPKPDEIPELLPLCENTGHFWQPYSFTFYELVKDLVADVDLAQWCTIYGAIMNTDAAIAGFGKEVLVPTCLREIFTQVLGFVVKTDMRIRPKGQPGQAVLYFGDGITASDQGRILGQGEIAALRSHIGSYLAMDMLRDPDEGPRHLYPLPMRLPESGLAEQVAPCCGKTLRELVPCAMTTIGSLVTCGAQARPSAGPYYVQDTRTYSGNAMVFWRPNSRGYTYRVDEAGLYTAEECRQLGPDKKRFWPKDVIERGTVRIADSERTQRNDLGLSLTFADMLTISPPEEAQRASAAELLGWDDGQNGRELRFQGEIYVLGLTGKACAKAYREAYNHGVGFSGLPSCRDIDTLRMHGGVWILHETGKPVENIAEQDEDEENGKSYQAQINGVAIPRSLLRGPHDQAFSEYATKLKAQEPIS